jgi:hypothetical protein
MDWTELDAFRIGAESGEGWALQVAVATVIPNANTKE